MADINKKTIPTRIPVKIIQDLDQALATRFKNNLMKKKDFNLVEGFRLIQRMPEWQTALKKLKIIPRREDVRNQGLF